MNAVDDNQVVIFDTTLRDGEQAPGCSMTLREKLRVATALSQLNVDVIEAGFPAASPGDFEAVNTIAKETKGIAVAGLARCKDGDPQRGVEALLPAEKPHLHLFIATSDIHLVHKLKMTREEALKAAVQWVSYARKRLGPDAELEFSAEDASRTEHDFLLKVYEAVVDAGATTVNIPDTVGYAIPAEGPGYMDTVSLIYGLDLRRRLVLGMQVLDSRDLVLQIIRDEIAEVQGAFGDKITAVINEHPRT